MLNINRLFLRKKKNKNKWQLRLREDWCDRRSTVFSTLVIKTNMAAFHSTAVRKPILSRHLAVLSLEVIFWTWTGSLHFLVKRYFYLRIMLNALASLNASIMHKSLTRLRFAIANPIVITNAQTWARYVAFQNLRKNGSGQSLFWFYFIYRTQSVKRLFPKSQ